MKQNNYKPGQIITQNNKTYKIIKMHDYFKNRVSKKCSFCDLFPYCYKVEKFSKYCIGKNQYLKLIK